MNTLKNKQEFDFIYKNGKRYYARGFMIFICRGQKEILIGLSVSKKVGNACKRNLIKRRFRALCRMYMQKLVGLSLVFVPRAEVLELSFLELEKEFLKCLHLSIKQKKDARF